ncbi:MAG: HD domain-containing phosphohydrolase [Thermoanaerobaculia bacterium]
MSPIVAQHHEAFDGSGYPNGLSGTEISLEARILAVADTYDAIRSDRPYCNGCSLAEAEILREQAGWQLDPDVVEALIAHLARNGESPD